MITHLRIRNFKSWEDTGVVRLAPLTGLFGTNSSGKTSLLQLLLLLRQTADSPDRNQVLHLGDDRSTLDLGTYPDIVFKHDTSRDLQWALDWDLPEALAIQDPETETRTLFSSEHLSYGATVAWQGNGDADAGRPIVRRMEYRFGEDLFAMELKPASPGQYELTHKGSDFHFVRSQGRVWPLPPPAKCYGFPDQVRGRYQNAAFLSDFELAFENLMQNLFYLGPLRDYPKRQYSWAGDRPRDMGRRGEKVVDALLAADDAGERVSRGRGKQRLSLAEQVAKWLKELQLIDSFDVKRVARGSKLYQVWVRQTVGSPEVLITDVGFGVSQILPVITLCYYAPPGATLILEQPEIHLHPSVQSGLADVFLDAIKTRNIQIVVESHSEHLLRRLQRRVAEEQIEPDQAALHFCRVHDGVSRLVPLKLDLFGTIQNWPDGFFGDEFNEIAATSKAAIERRKQARDS